MVDMNMTTILQGRKNRRQQKMARFAKANTPERVRVVPRSESLRRVLVHPNGTKFRAEGSREWPLDQFTRRRLREGAITIEKVAAPEAAPQAATQAAAPAKRQHEKQPEKQPE
jgi:hypothetical protein